MEGEAEGADDVEGIFLIEETLVGAEGFDEATVDVETHLTVGALDGDMLLDSRAQDVAGVSMSELTR